jgi:hypothetical protein
MSEIKNKYIKRFITGAMLLGLGAIAIIPNMIFTMQISPDPTYAIPFAILWLYISGYFMERLGFVTTYEKPKTEGEK